MMLFLVSIFWRFFSHKTNRSKLCFVFSFFFFVFFRVFLFQNVITA